MTATAAAPSRPEASLLSAPEPPKYAPSPAGPVDTDTPIHLPPGSSRSRLRQTLAFATNPYNSALRDTAQYGEVWKMELLTRKDPFYASSHPDHIRSIFTAKPDDAPAINYESPLKLWLGDNSVLMLVGPKHMRERKLLLPPFHGDAVARYIEMIKEVTAEEVDRWQQGSTFALAPRMQAITLEVIMRGVLGIEGLTSWRTPERRFREIIKHFLGLSTLRGYQLLELANSGNTEPKGPLKPMIGTIHSSLDAVIKARRAEGENTGRNDVFSLLLAARDEDGQPLTDDELRDELLTLILAGHETTANSLAWTCERLMRNPRAYDRLREEVRAGTGEAYVEATIHEGMRVRPVINFVARKIQRPWRFGEYVLPAGTGVALSITGLHHRPDVYAQPHRFMPERFLDAEGKFVKPGTYTWIPFGGGIRRCLGATLAMAEQRVVLEEIARSVDLEAPDPEPERGRQRNVTTIPIDGGRATIAQKLS
ncbi:MAG: cytochrome P450 [Solirubrobacterales bacterium]|nr:cytochrome P450 [Solirubrobacterales bacterium]